MRFLAAAAVLAAAIGCGREAAETTPAAAPEADRRHADKRARASECLAYQLEYWKRAATERAVGRSPAPPELPRYACAALYSEPSCGRAWPSDAAALAPLSDARRIARACAAAYCPSLDAPRLALCGTAVVPDAELVAALVALDAAILDRELGDPAQAARLAARHRLFRTPVEEGPAPPAATLVVTIAADGALILGADLVDPAELERRIAAAHAHNADLAVNIMADRNIPYATVVSLLDTIRRTGVTKIQLGTNQ